MKGLVLSARDKLMFTLVLALILFIGIIAIVTIDPAVGIALVLFDFLLAVIVLLAGSPDDSASAQGRIVHQGRYPAVQPDAATPAAPAAAPAATETAQPADK